MAFLLVRPHTPRATYWQKAASTAFTINTLVVADESESATAGTFTAATSSTERALGAIRKAVASTDSDYASTTREEIRVDMEGEWLANVAAANAADANDAGGFVDLTDATQLDVTASAIDAFFVSRFISATFLRGYIVRWHYNEAPATN